MEAANVDFDDESFNLLSSMDQIEQDMGILPPTPVPIPASSSVTAIRTHGLTSKVAVVTPASGSLSAPKFTFHPSVQTQPPPDSKPSSSSSNIDKKVEEEEDSDVSTDRDTYRKATITCNAMRIKITNFLATKEMTQAEFLDQTGLCSSSLYRFMKLKGKWNNLENNTYWYAKNFFTKREKKEKKKKAAALKAAKEAEKQSKKRSHGEMAGGSKSATSTGTTPAPPASAAPAAPAAPAAVASGPLSFAMPEALFSTTAALHPLVGSDRGILQQRAEEVMRVVNETWLREDRVFDDCDEVRRKIGVITQSNIMSKTEFYRAIGCSSSSVSKFMAKKGPDQGAGLSVYPNAYRFFEKLRIILNKPKTHKRTSNETKNPNGFSLQNPKPVYYVVPLSFTTTMEMKHK